MMVWSGLQKLTELGANLTKQALKIATAALVVLANNPDTTQQGRDNCWYAINTLTQLYSDYLDLLSDAQDAKNHD